MKKTDNSNIINNYNEFIWKCKEHLNKLDHYDKKEVKIDLLNIYNKNKYNFKLKVNTVDNIINRWKSNSIKFTKYNAIENRLN